MIRVNLLEVERGRATKKGAFVLSAAHRVTIAATLILLATVVGIGWWFMSLRQQSAQLDIDLASAEAETQKLRSVLAQVQSFEARKAQLTQRVTLIEQLRKGQAAPVHVLDQISRSLPDRLWLTELKQTGQDFTLTGFSTSLTGLSDLVANLESTKWFLKPVEILDSQVQADQKAQDLVKFSVKATLNNPDPPQVAPSGKGRR